MKRLPFVALLSSAVAASALGLVSCDKSGPKPLIIGMELTYPPFEFKDSSGNPDGVERAHGGSPRAISGGP